jgi:hypothetical protein
MQRSIPSYALLLIIFLLFAPTAMAQLKVYPLPGPAEHNTSKSKSKKSIARTQELTPRSLPFWDDFSWTAIDNRGNAAANYPVDSLWVNNYKVWINNGLGLNPPSQNVATLNGLDSAEYSPYSDQSIATGFRDTLVSQPIKLDEVASADRNSVYLSFFYQWSGNGEPPDANDYLRVDFKNDQGAWESVMTIRTTDTFQNNEFYDTLVKVDGDRFFHEAFQFRFMNYGRLSGPYDTWNIDYVYLNKNRTANDNYLPDRTIMSSLTNLFNDYRAVPYGHFKDQILLGQNPISSPTYDVFNVQNDTSTLSYSTQGTFINFKDSAATITIIDTLGNAGTSPIDGITGIIYSRERKTVTLEHVPDGNDPTQFDPEADSVAVSLKVQLFTGDTFNPKTGDFANDYNPAKYQPLDFRSNDTIRADYWLKDYYAYDDGLADYSVALTAFGNRAAYLFEMLTPEPDTLVGFDIYYPDYGVPSNLTVDFTVYNDADGLPGIPLYTLPSYSISRIGSNKFEKIRFGEQFLVRNKFYIGWKAPVGGTFKVGLDTNNDSGAKLFVNTNGSWFQSTDIAGAVMIRPVFGGGEIITGIPEEELQSQIYPNPNDGDFFVPRDFKIISISNLAGQTINYSVTDHGEHQRVNLSTASAGLYILRLQKHEQLFSSKIVIR